MRTSTFTSLTLMAALAIVNTAPARSDDDPGRPPEVQEAYDLAASGVEKFKEGESLHQGGDIVASAEAFKDALDLFDRADQVVHLPSVGLRAARCLERLGRWREASERYEAVTKRFVPPHLSPAHAETQQQAKEEAAQAREALARAMPTITIVVEGAGADEAIVSLDGTVLPRPIDGALDVDPTLHVVHARLGSTDLECARFEMKANEHRRIRCEIGSPQAPEHAKPASANVIEPAPASTPAIVVRARPSWRRRAGWTLVAAGAAGVAAGALAGGMALSQQSELDVACPDRRCPPSLSAAVDDYDRMRTISSAGFGVGAVGIGLGLVLVITSGRSTVVPQHGGADLHVHVGPSSLAFSGHF